MKSCYARFDSCCLSFRFYAVVEHFIVAFYSAVLYVQRDSISEGKIDHTQKIQILLNPSKVPLGARQIIAY